MKKNTLKDGLDAKMDAKRDTKSSFCCSDTYKHHQTHPTLKYNENMLFFSIINHKFTQKYSKINYLEHGNINPYLL